MPFVAALLLALLTLSTSVLADAPDWSGTWNTRWRDGGARVEMKQESGKVTGSYLAYDGRIEGEARDRVLTARWFQGGRSGAVEFVLAPDGQSFMGRFDSGEWWTGGRISGDAREQGLIQTGPRETMRSFLQAGNDARYDAPDQMVRAVAVVDFGDGAAAMAPEEKLGKAQTLFNLVDQTTFRLHSIPDARAGGEEAAVDLEQAGTGAVLALRFVKRGERWFLSMPDDTTLAEARKSLFARSGGRPASPEAYRLRKNARDAYRTFTRAFYTWSEDGRRQALDSLDLRALSDAVRDDQGGLTAQYLNGILNRIGLLQPQEISDDPANRSPAMVFSHPVGQMVIAPDGVGDGATWKFSGDTVRNARDLYVAVEGMPSAAGQRLPEPPSIFFQLRRSVRGLAPNLLMPVGPLEAWQALGWPAIMVLSLALGWLVSKPVSAFLVRAVGRHDAHQARRTFRLPLLGTLTLIVYAALMPALGLPDLATRVSVGVAGVLFALSTVWFGWRIIDAVVATYFTGDETGRPSMDNILVSLGFGALKIALVGAGLTYVAMQLSLPYEGVIASLSIGGLAVAFASRETLSNVFGAGILAIDRPFRRGDWISTGDTKGTVEHVGIRSTRVRTADDSLIVVPNGKLSDAVVNNLGTRRFHLNSAKLPLPYATSVPQIEALVSGVRELVAEIPESAPDRTQVSVSNLSQDSIEVTVRYGLDVRNGANETEIVNRLMMNILRLSERIGIRGANGGAPAPAE
ncbi:mechanosensitive ion channel domain-containing protein [Methylobacterium sp. 77]|uniref:mechanosensitive ion channel family protein n=1 Tax=Methylobacterium sp. 77 TaxID=1101192 RepID=UPI0003755AFA|nr:mechanosensitive ion channel domain-containing protein [Methylobacterium sp. 77]